MIFAADDSVVVLLGPKPLVPPTWLESYWAHVVGGVVFAYLIFFLIFKFLQRQRPATAPFIVLQNALQRELEVAGVTQALRTYLAAIDQELSPALSTEELATKLQHKPIFLPARSPLLTVLRTADQAKFAQAPTDVVLLVAGIREAAQRIENAQKIFQGGKA